MNLDDLEHRGFRASDSDGEGYLRVRCYGCAALVINGVPCHETGCPEKPVECRECGCLIPRGDSCDCMEPVDDDLAEVCDWSDDEVGTWGQG